MINKLQYIHKVVIILKYNKGFTLVELIIVIALIGLMAILIVPSVIKTLNKADQKLLKIQEQQVEDAAEIYLEDYCLSPLNDTYECPLSYTIDSSGEILYSGELDLDVLIENKYMDEVNIKGIRCIGEIIITDNNPDALLACGEKYLSEGMLKYKLMAHYPFDDFQEPTTNIFPRTPHALAFVNAYNGTNYGFGSGTDLQQVIDNTGRWETRASITKVSRITGGTSQRDYIYINLSSPLNSVRVFSFWYYGTYGTQIRPYNNDLCANLYYLDENNNWIGGATGIVVPVKVNEWQKITIKMVNLGTTAGTGLTWVILHNNSVTTTLDTSQYWAFTMFQMEEKSYATEYTDGTRIGTIDDKSINNLDASLTASTTPRWIDGCSVGSGCYQFNGVNTYINAGNSSHFNLTNVGSVSLWAKTSRSYPSDDANAKYRGIISKTPSGSATGVSYFIDWTGTNASRTLRAAIGDSTNFTAVNANDFNFNGKWNHIALIWNGNNIILYINGVEVNRKVQDRNAQIVSKEVEIGRAFSSNSYVWDGGIDDVRIYNRALSVDEIKSLYGMGK